MVSQELKDLALHAAMGTAPTNYTAESVDEALRGELNKLASNLNEFMSNRYDIYNIIIETADKVVPKKVLSSLGMFADVQFVPQNQRAIFKRGKLGKARARKFVTQVGLSGLYETFRLDQENFELAAHAVGGAATIDFERFLDGAETMAEVMDLVTEGLTDAVYVEVQRALRRAVQDGNFPANNKVSVNGWKPDEMMKIITNVRSYGDNAVIFAPPEFIAAMGPDCLVAGGTGFQGVYAPSDLEDIHKTGLIKMFRGTPVVELRQSFLDENNEQKMIHPQYAYVLPSAKEKVVKIAMEGPTQIWDATNRDQSIEINTYRMIGVGILTFNNWGIYQNTGISAANWYDSGVLNIDIDYHIEG